MTDPPPSRCRSPSPMSGPRPSGSRARSSGRRAPGPRRCRTSSAARRRQVREPPVHRVVQGPGRAQPAAHPDRRGASRRRRRRVGRQPRPGRRPPRRPPRHRRHDRDAGVHPVRQGRAHARPRRDGRAQGRDGRRRDGPRSRSSSRPGCTFVHPFDDPLVIAGAGTVGLELLADHPDLDVLVVPVGGGGLIAGVAIAARELRPDIEIVGVQTETYPSMVTALAEGESQCPGGPTMAEGIAVPTAGRLTRRIVAALVDDVVTVTRVGHRGRRQPVPRDREGGERGRGRRRPRRPARASRAVRRPARRRHPHRRQHRPPAAGLGHPPGPGAQRPAVPPAGDGRRPARDAGPADHGRRRRRRQHHRGHPPAGVRRHADPVDRDRAGGRDARPRPRRAPHGTTRAPRATGSDWYRSTGSRPAPPDRTWGGCRACGRDDHPKIGRARHPPAR